ncbi:MAG: 4Fe-4S binding protein [Bacillota bacterium]|nr:4Fe-4S binding protein [Bacillota bacterium]
MELKRKISGFQRVRRIIIFLWILALPFALIRLSPAAIVFSSRNKILSIGIIFLVIWFISSFFTGRLYCSIGCPFGAGQDIMAMLLPKRLSPKGRRTMRILRYIFFIVWFFPILATIISGGFKSVNLFYPQSADGSIKIDSLSLASSLLLYYPISIAIFIILTLVFGNRSTCNYFCPMNALGIIGTKFKNKVRYPSLHLEVNKKNCVGCKRCDEACPMSLNTYDMVKDENMYNPECILCGSCIEACNKKVISYAWKWKKEQK